MQKHIPTVLILPTFFTKKYLLFLQIPKTYLLFRKTQGRFLHEKIALRSVCETLICVKEFMQGSLHIGMQVCECGLADIPF